MDLLKDYPLLRTDSYAKIFLYNTHETVACVPRHTIRMRDKVKPDKLQQAVEEALLRFPHMVLGVEATDTAFRYRANVLPPVVLPFDGVEKRYTIGSKDTHGYMFLVGYDDKTITMEYQHSISDGRGFEEFIRCVIFQYLNAVRLPGRERRLGARAWTRVWSPEESADGYEQLADQEFSPARHLEKACGLARLGPDRPGRRARDRHRGDLPVRAAARLRQVDRRQPAVHCRAAAHARVRPQVRRAG